MEEDQEEMSGELNSSSTSERGERAIVRRSSVLYDRDMSKHDFN
jgi:hypothetical protein